MDESESEKICRHVVSHFGRDARLLALINACKELICAVAKSSSSHSINEEKEKESSELYRRISDVDIGLIEFRIIISLDHNLTYSQVKEKNADYYTQNGKKNYFTEKHIEKFFDNAIRRSECAEILTHAKEENPLSNNDKKRFDHEYLQIIRNISLFIEEIKKYMNGKNTLDDMWEAFPQIGCSLHTLRAITREKMNEIDYQTILNEQLTKMKKELKLN